MMRLTMGLTVGVLLLGVAGCGGSEDGDNGIATVGGTPTASAAAGAPGGGNGEDAVFKYTACMREAGIPMDDPEVGEGGAFKMKMSVPKGIDKATVEAAQEKCRPLLPSGGQAMKPSSEQAAAQREMAKCMRENGVPNFPDPSAEGGIKISPDMGVNPEDPAFKAAEEKCKPEGAEAGQ